MTEVIIDEMIALNTPKGSAESYEPSTIRTEPQPEQVSPAEEVFTAEDKGTDDKATDEIPF
ncbi:MAG: hypothetical protein UW48_C0010G0001 [Microgenomates group bacterium GW2011_GWC1_44_23]|nr:MAG: hypothetical protein UW48_C0010G0001 [Microgenomates group bacterium GW2011_GWC1_44_23]